MDFSKFTDDNFDCKEWVNAALRAKKDSQTPLDVSVLCSLWFNRTLTQVARILKGSVHLVVCMRVDGVVLASATGHTQST